MVHANMQYANHVMCVSDSVRRVRIRMQCATAMQQCGASGGARRCGGGAGAQINAAAAMLQSQSAANKAAKQIPAINNKYGKIAAGKYGYAAAAVSSKCNQIMLLQCSMQQQWWGWLLQMLASCYAAMQIRRRRNADK